MEVTLEKAITAYLNLRRPSFVEANPNVPIIFAAAGTALASRMYVWGIDLIPATFYIALVSKPRTGKSTFVRTFLRLFDGTGISSIPIGSPEAILKTINDVRHGYLWYDEIDHLSRLLDAYMGTLPSILNKAYYLDELGQTRMNERKSVVVPAEQYFIHVYMSGTWDAWQKIEKKVVSGFIRRVLVIPVRGHIPYFKARRPSQEDIEISVRFRNWVRTIYKLLAMTKIEVVLPQFEAFGDILERVNMDEEKKSMVEEYFYKVMAGRVVNNLITFDPQQDYNQIILNDILHIMKKNGEKYGISVEFGDIERPPVEVVIDASSLDEEVGDPPEITDYIPPRFGYVTFRMLLDTVKTKAIAPDEVTTLNVERIQKWLESGGSPVVSKRVFVREILHIGNPSQYEAVIKILEDAGYIKTVSYMYKGRHVQYIILDTKAKICGNCAYFRTDRCPRIAHYFTAYSHDRSELWNIILSETHPADEPCEKFEPADGGE